MLESSTTREEELDFVKALQQLVGAVFRLNSQLLTTAEQLSTDLSISTSRWQALAVLRETPLTVSQISRRIGVTRQSARQAVRKLKEGGFLEFRENPEHRRSPLVALTDTGEEAMVKLIERQISVAHYFTNGTGISVKQLEALTRQLENIRGCAEAIEYQPD